MGEIVSTLFGAQGGDLGGILPPPGSSPGFAGGHFGGDPRSMALDIANADIADVNPVQGMGDAIPEEVVKGFKPKKRSILGVIGDAILLNQGHKGPFFADRVKGKNTRRAYEGFTHDPMETVRRLSTFDQEAASKLYDKIIDNQRMDRVQNRQDAIQELKFQEMVASMMGASNPSNYKAFLNRAKTMGNRLGYDMSYLPEEYNEDAINQLRYGAMTVDQQFDNQRQDANAESLIGYRNERLEDFDAQRAGTEAYRGRRAGEIERHNRVMEAKPVGGKKSGGESGKEGREIPGIGKVRYNEDKTRAIVITDDGQRMQLQRQPDGKWKRFK